MKIFAPLGVLLPLRAVVERMSTHNTIRIIYTSKIIILATIHRVFVANREGAGIVRTNLQRQLFNWLKLMDGCVVLVMRVQALN